MKTAVILATFVISTISVLAQQGQTADWVARQIQDRDTGRDSHAEMRMRLFDRQGRVRERALTVDALRMDSGDCTLLRFLSERHQGHRLPGVGAPGADDERFSSARADARAADSRRAKSRKASWAATSATKTSAAATWRTTPTRLPIRTRA
jgi:hypothetical protein